MLLFYDDPREKWTPGRWLRYRVTGDPLHPRERERKEFYERVWEDINDMEPGATALRVGEQWEYWGLLEQKYGLNES